MPNFFKQGQELRITAVENAFLVVARPDYSNETLRSQRSAPAIERHLVCIDLQALCGVVLEELTNAREMAIEKSQGDRFQALEDELNKLRATTAAQEEELKELRQAVAFQPETATADEV